LPNLNNKNSKTKNLENFNEVYMRTLLKLPILAIISVMLLSACSNTKRESHLDFSSPANVLQAVFTAAKTNDFFELKGLCDPKGKNDGDTKEICGITKDHPDKKEFIRNFHRARINGAVYILGHRAKVPFLYGHKGKKKETMHMISRNGKWFLYKY